MTPRLITRRESLWLAAAGFAGWQVKAQQVKAQQADPTFSADVNVVNVLATVRDKQGQIVRNLPKEDFSIEENLHPQTIKYFAQQSDLPLTLGLLVDTSGSQRRVLEPERRASYRFFEKVLREDKDQAFVMHFDYDVELLQDLTSSRKDLEAALSDLDTPNDQPRLNRRPTGQPGPPPGGRRRGGGGTALYDSVLLAADELMRKQTGRKALVLLTDGVDNGSKVTLSTAIEHAQRADTLVYGILFADQNGYAQGRGPAIGFPGGGRRGGRGGGRGPVPSSAPRGENGKKILERLSAETGGRYYEVSGKQSIDKIYESIEEELRYQYNLGYNSDQTGSGFRRIHVAVKQKNLTVQTRDGYYAK